MDDVAFLLLIVALFVVTAALVPLFERLRR
jgi:hypothetical protein